MASTGFSVETNQTSNLSFNLYANIVDINKPNIIFEAVKDDIELLFDADKNVLESKTIALNYKVTGGDLTSLNAKLIGSTVLFSPETDATPINYDVIVNGKTLTTASQDLSLSAAEGTSSAIQIAIQPTTLGSGGVYVGEYTDTVDLQFDASLGTTN